MSKNLEDILENQYYGDSIVDVNLFNKQLMESFLKDSLIYEASSKKLARKPMTLTIESIPAIAVSEHGWSANSAQRTELLSYLRNIKPGGSLEEKIQAINKFSSATAEDLKSSGLLSKDSNSKRIQQLLSYLVFLKTLTTILTNFNARSAGFAFESFLAVLLGGTQIEAAGGAGGTIADLKTKEGEYISLKLYGENSLHVGGSYEALMNDLADKPGMKYIVALKGFSGEKLEAEGKISIHEFTFNIDNVMNIFSKAHLGGVGLVELPKEYIKTNGTNDFSKLTPSTAVLDKEIKKVFSDTLSQKFVSYPELKDELIKRIYEATKKYPEELFKPTKTSGRNKDELYEELMIGYSNPDPEFLKSLFIELAEEGLLKDNKIKNGVARIMEAFKTAKDYKDETLSKNTRINKWKEQPFASVAESVIFYNALKSKEEKAKALRNTKGYILRRKFSMTKEQMFAVPGYKHLGNIAIGNKSLNETVSQVSSLIDEAIFSIFESLQSLTKNLNLFFATGLKNDAAAVMAQTAAKNIDKATGKLLK